MNRVTLVLAQGPGKPDGDIGDRLIMTVPLTAQGQLDVDAFHNASSPWLAVHEIPGRETRTLEIIRIDEGWAFQSTHSEDDPICGFEGHVFRPGELVRLDPPDSEELLFRIVNAERE